jgi:RimJ/RimL family protein N-acetyltransferase
VVKVGEKEHDHPLARLLRDVAAGRPPASDGTVDVLPSLGAGGDDVVLTLNGRLVITTDVGEAELRARFPDGDYLAWCHPRSVLWLSERAGRGLGTADILFAAPSVAGPAPVPLDPLEAEHPRVRESRLRRADVRAWATPDDGDRAGGMVSVARGVADRWELAYEVEPAARGRGLGVALARAGRHLVPAGEVLWAQTAPGNVASVRALLAAGLRPVAGETLLLAPGDDLP